jgi:hypothetical protein
MCLRDIEFDSVFSFSSFRSLDCGRTWWRLFQNRVMRTKLDIYVCISTEILVEFGTVRTVWCFLFSILRFTINLFSGILPMVY